MSGELVALMSAVCYALASIFLRKGQMQTKAPGNGLLPVLFIGTVCLVGTTLTKLPLESDDFGNGGHWVFPVAMCALSGLCGTLLGRIALYSTISRFGATRGVIVNAMAPCITLFIAFTFLDESLDKFDIYGICCFALGLGLLVVEQMWLRTYRSTGLVAACIVALCAPLFQGGGFILRKIGVGASIDPLLAASIDLLAAFVLYVVILGITGRLGEYVRFYWHNRSYHFLIAGSCSTFAVLFFFEASTMIPVSLVAMIIGIQPVIVALISTLFLTKIERVSWVTAISSVVVAVGVIFMSQ